MRINWTAVGMIAMESCVGDYKGGTVMLGILELLSVED